MIPCPTFRSALQPLALFPVLVAMAACSSTTTLPAACQKAGDYCGSSAAQNSECAGLVAKRACATELEAEVDCLISNKASCNAAHELRDDLPACDGVKAAYEKCAAATGSSGGGDAGTMGDAASSVDAGLPAQCQRIDTYCKARGGNDKDCTASVASANAKSCLPKFDSALDCLLANGARCNAAGELDDNVSACRAELDALSACMK